MIGDSKDVGLGEDWAYAIQNLISAEHHAIESWCQTKDRTFLEINEKVRHLRSNLMYHFTPENRGQTYCLTKHLLASAQALKELGNRFTEKGNDTLAEDLFKQSQEMEAIIILLNEFGEKKGEVEDKGFINKFFKGGHDV